MIYFIYLFLAMIIATIVFIAYTIKFMVNHNMIANFFAYQNPPFVVHETYHAIDYVDSFRYVDEADIWGGKWSIGQYINENERSVLVDKNGSHVKWEVERRVQKMAKEMLNNGCIEIWKQNVNAQGYYTPETTVYLKAKVYKKGV